MPCGAPTVTNPGYGVAVLSPERGTLRAIYEKKDPSGSFFIQFPLLGITLAIAPAKPFIGIV